MTNPNLETLLIVFIAITGAAVLLQACVLLGMYLTMRKAVQTGKEQADEFRSKIVPVLDSSKEFLGIAKALLGTAQDLIKQLEPKLDSAASDLAGMARDLHVQTYRLQVSADEIAQKVRRQADRVDGMTTSVLNGVDRFGNFVNEAVKVPVRQVSGIMAAAKAVVETLRAPVPHQRKAPSTTDVPDEKDLFV
jgi:methyl-accepting chemotaxis protein